MKNNWNNYNRIAKGVANQQFAKSLKVVLGVLLGDNPTAIFSEENLK